MAAVVGVAAAVDSQALAAIRMPAPFISEFARNTPGPERGGRTHGSPISLGGPQSRTSNLNSNRSDNGLRRQMPDFASPFRKGEQRPPPMEEVRTGSELIPAAERRRRAA